MAIPPNVPANPNLPLNTEKTLHDPLSTLPEGPILEIFKNYTIPELLNARLPSKAWKQKVDTSEIWKILATRLQLTPTVQNPTPQDYKQLVMNNCKTQAFVLQLFKEMEC